MWKLPFLLLIGSTWGGGVMQALRLDCVVMLPKLNHDIPPPPCQISRFA